MSPDLSKNTFLSAMLNMILTQPFTHFRFDLVDLTRQFLVNLMPNLYQQVVEAFEAKNLVILLEKSQNILNLLWDLDELLGSHPDFLLGTWLKSAKSIPDLTENEQKLFEFNARNQITLWGPEAQCLKIPQKVSKMAIFF